MTWYSRLGTMVRICIVLWLLPWASLSSAQTTKESKPAAPMMVIEMQPGDTHLRPMTAGPGKLSRWLELQAASVSVRYRYVDDFHGRANSNGAQYQVGLRGALHLDAAGRFAIYAGLFSGNSFTSGWNSTGLGIGSSARSNLYLKRLYLQATPAKGIQVQFGSFDFARGESTEITSYSYNGYVAGERLTILRPENIFFDEVAVTFGYIGHLNQPSAVRRLSSLEHSNYHQILIEKHAGSRVRMSADYTVDSGIRTLRQAFTMSTSRLRITDIAHFEQSEDIGRRKSYGYSAYGEKKTGSRISLGAGYAQLDRHALFSDRFDFGKRLFWNTHVELSKEWSLTALTTYAVAGRGGSAPRTRFDLIVGFNLLHRLRVAELL